MYLSIEDVPRICIDQKPTLNQFHQVPAGFCAGKDSYPPTLPTIPVIYSFIHSTNSH